MRVVAVLVVTWSILASREAAGQPDPKDPKSDVKEPKTEFGILPLAGGDSDVGVGGGELSSITRYVPGYSPYRWRLESGAVITLKPPDGDEGWRVPYQDVYLDWVVPELVPKKVRFELRPSYTREATQSYYGIGNAAPAPTAGPEGQPASDFFQYGRMHPTLLVRLRVTLANGFFFLFGNFVTYNRIDVHADSQLGRDMAPGSPTRRFFGPLGPHFVDVFEYGLLYDTRDDETDTHAGAYHQLKMRLSPGGTASLPYRYGQANVIARFYASPIPRWLTLGLRVIGDAQFGDPPFYELARYEDTFALGGSNGVRGIPGQRYYGKVKLLGNLEARSELVTFTVSSKEYALGLAAFFDCGRLWSGFSRDPSLDGSGAGLKYGTGGGIRFRQGKSFVVRADVAWSPDANPVGAYVTAGQAF